MERGLSILWIDAICGSVQNSMTPPEKACPVGLQPTDLIRGAGRGTWSAIGSANSVGKPTLYERGCHRPIFPHQWLKQGACGRASGRCRTRRFAQDENRPGRAPSERSADDPVARPAHAGRSAPEPTARLRLHPRVSAADQAPRVEMRFAIDAPDPRATNPDPVLLKEVKRARR